MDQPLSNCPSHPTGQSRFVERLITGRPTSDGAEVKLTRVIGGALQQRLDPFLMLDAFRSDDAADYIGGFPDHPHRGFETVTYLIAGRMRHRDSARNQGLLESGGMQWMLAGRGVIHSEMPEQEDGALEGFQLWLNLPARDKLTTPAYRDVQSEDIPEFTTGSGVRVRVLLGESHGVVGAVRRPVTAPLLLDIHLPGGAAFSQPLPASHHACLYVYRGEVAVGGEAIADQQLAILANSAADGVTIDAQGPARVLLIAGQPLHEPIAQHGPFVMNTEAEIRQAVADYQSGRLAAP
jgi:redox-sensitive bicupin YhaK (pirin superfamily)